MKKTFTTLFLAGMQLAFSQTNPTLIIKDINVISMTDHQSIIKKSIAISKGIIFGINDFGKLPKDKNTVIIDGTNQYIMPSLTEMHSHLPEKEKIDTILTSYIASGVTHVRVMFSQEPPILMREIISKKEIKPKIYYPFLLTKDLAVSSQIQMDSLFLDIKKNNYDFVKMYSMQWRADFNDTIFDRIMFSARKNNVIVCGHYPNKIKLDRVLTSGFKSIEHLGGYANLPEDKIALAIELTKKNEVYNCPTLDWDVMSYDLPFPNEYSKRLIYHIAPKHYIEKWDNAMQVVISENGAEKLQKGKEEYLPTYQKKMSILKRLNDSGNLLLLGGEAGNLYQLEGFNMYEEMVNWSKAGISNIDILKAATINPAMFFNEESKWGTIEVGKEADLLILLENPLSNIENMKTLSKIIMGGKIYDKLELLKKI